MGATVLSFWCFLSEPCLSLGNLVELEWILMMRCTCKKLSYILYIFFGRTKLSIVDGLTTLNHSIDGWVIDERVFFFSVFF